MTNELRRVRCFALSATLLLAVNVNSAAASSQSAAEALARKFSDGPAAEERAAKRAAQQRKAPQVSTSRAPPMQVRSSPAQPQVWPQDVDSKQRQSGWNQRLDALADMLRRTHQQRKSTPGRRNIDVGARPPRTIRSERPVVRPDRSGAQAQPTVPQPKSGRIGRAIRTVTVLMVMRAREKWRHRPVRRSIDPVLCVGGTCYISAGSNQASREMTRAAALGPVNSIGRRAGACRRMRHCAFRQVDLAAQSAMLQPIDLGWLRHDRRAAVEATADTTCQLIAGRLSCRRAIETSDYRLWIVPEFIAEAAGPQALRQALQSGLKAVQQNALSTFGIDAITHITPNY